MRKGFDYTGISVVYFCHDGQGNVLMQKRGNNCRDEQGKWDIGGGGLEFGDTVENTLKKEIAEEYCTDVLEAEFLGFQDVHREQGNEKTHWIALCYKVLVDREKVKNGEPHKFDEIQWRPFNDLPAPLHSYLPKFLEKFAEKLKK